MAEPPPREKTAEACGILVARVGRLENSTVWVVLPGSIAAVRVDISASPFSQLAVGSLVAVARAAPPAGHLILLGPIVDSVPEFVPPKEIQLEASGKITLRCGKASLSLSADGDAALRGVNVTTRASATNRVRGGNVQIN
ncbi:MAG: hypothetical protein U0572_10140 [Phycisphaerales bacterium]